MKRRKFIQHTSMASIAACLGLTAEKLKLSFSTLGCPDWSFEQIMKFAVDHGYQGLEIRGILREMDLPKASPFNSAQKISETIGLMNANKLEFVDLGSSSTMHFADPVIRKKNIDEGKRFIDLAAALGCRYVRVFPNIFPKDQAREKTLELMVSGLQELGNYANNTKVTVLLETHGELLYADDIVKVMKAANHPRVALIWDMVNMWSVTKEPPAEVYPKLKPWIRHAHIKDLKIINGKNEYSLIGKGEAPVFESIDLLRKDAYQGYYSFEWEKLWHPEIAAPEIAIADYAEVMRRKYG